MATEFKLPDLGEGVDRADVAQINVSEGDQIHADQNVMELETEKAVADLPCPHAGTVSQVHVSVGDTVNVGQTLLTIETEAAEQSQDQDDKNDGSAETPADEQQPHQSDESEGDQEDGDGDAEESIAEDVSTEAGSDDKPAEDGRQADAGVDDGESADEKPSGNGEDRPSQKDEQHPMPPPAGPATRRLARALDIDLDQFEPPDGNRIRQEDVVRAYVESGKADGLVQQSLPDFEKFGAIRREPLNDVAKTAARRLTFSWRTIPHVTQHDTADVTKLEAARREHTDAADEGSPKITMTSILLKALAGLLREFPKFNSSLDTDTEELILKQHYHLGVAVDTDHGLLVPVLRDIDRKSVEQIAAELENVANQARRRQLGKEDFEGGTFTLSNQGGIGGGQFTPIINFPEVAILGVGRMYVERNSTADRPEERLMLPLSLSYDHRVINGADAVQFMTRLTSILATEFTLLIAS